MPVFWYFRHDTMRHHREKLATILSVSAVGAGIYTGEGAIATVKTLIPGNFQWLNGVGGAAVRLTQAVLASNSAFS